jgi:hypothetical protein
VKLKPPPAHAGKPAQVWKPYIEGTLLPLLAKCDEYATFATRFCVQQVVEAGAQSEKNLLEASHIPILAGVLSGKTVRRHALLQNPDEPGASYAPCCGQ